MIRSLLNADVAVARPQGTSDDAGGETVTYVDQDPVRALVAQPSAAEREAAGKWGALLTHVVYLEPDADVRRGDRLTPTGGTGLRALRVLATSTNSRSTYLRADCELIEQAA